MCDELTSAELRQLYAFANKANELEYATKNYLLQHITISFDANNPTEAPIEGFIDNIIESGLLALIRQLVNEKEKVSFMQICEIICKYHKKNKQKQERVKQYEKAWKEKIIGHNSPICIDIDGQTLKNDRLIKLLLYTGRLHTNVNKETYQQMLSLRESGYSPILQLQLSGIIEGASTLVNSLKSEFIDQIIE